jgi:hypothetical protein
MYRAALHSGKLAGRVTLMPQILYTAPPNSDEIRSADTFDAGDQPDWLAIGPTRSSPMARSPRARLPCASRTGQTATTPVSCSGRPARWPA